MGVLEVIQFMYAPDYREDREMICLQFVSRSRHMMVSRNLIGQCNGRFEFGSVTVIFLFVTDILD